MTQVVEVRSFVERGAAEITTGPFGTQLKAAEYVDEGVPVINVRNVGFGDIRADKLEYLPEEGAERLKRHRLKANDIVFGRKGAVERHAFIRPGQTGWVQGSDCIRLRFLTDEVDPQFVSYTFQTHEHQQWMLAHGSSGATMHSLNQDIIGRIPLTLPPLPTQRKIAAILSAYDDLIENNARRVRVLEQMARALYRQWFVEYHFPDHEQAEWIEDEAGRRPKGWEQKKLGDIAMELRRSVEPSEIAPDTHYVGLEHIPRRKIALDDWGTAADVQSTKLRFDAGDVLFGKIRPYFHKVSVAPMGGVCSTDAIVIKALKPELRPLMVMTVASDEFVEHSVQTSNGTKMPRANWKVLTQYPVVVPPSELLEKFNAIVEDVIQQGANFTQRNANLRQTRDLLLPRLVSGELDVSALDVRGVVEEAEHEGEG